MLFAGVLILTGCFGAAQDGDVIPWAEIRPQAGRQTLVPLAPPCRAVELTAKLFLEGAGGDLIGGVLLRNRAARPCSLLGRPEVQLSGGATPSTRWRAKPGRPLPMTNSGIGPPAASLRALGRHTEGWVGLVWSNWCPTGTLQTSSGPGPDHLTLRLPHRGGLLTLPVRGAPRCDAPRRFSVIGVAPFRPRAEEPSRSSRLPFKVSFGGIRQPEVKFGRPKLEVRRGRVLRYEIALTNTSTRPFVFARCPVFIQRLTPGVKSRPYVLNCKPAGTFEPGERKAFAMELGVPSRTPVGRSALTWVLDPSTFDPPWAPAIVLVTK